MRDRKTKLALLVLFGLITAMVQAQGISVTVNGDPVQFAGTGPQMVNGRVLVPLRGIFEKLGAYVEWHADRREVVANRGQNSVSLQIGNPSATVNGQNVNLDVPAQILNGSTMVPIRFVSESIGAQVRWIEAQQQVIITADAAPGQGDTAPVDTAPAQQEPDPNDAGTGPVRMARISYLEGAVSWRPGDDVDWSQAGPNIPLRQGAQIWLNPGSRAELQFDDGSVVRLGNNALATLQTMYSDDKGEFTEIRLNTGTASMRLTNNYSSYQIDAPIASATASGPANLRVDATNGFRLLVRAGQAQVQGDAGKVSIGSGEYLSLSNSSSSYVVRGGDSRDDWDGFCDRRDGIISHPSRNLPSNIALVAGDLDTYGTWVRDPQYGNCWRPNGVDGNWAPYRNGHWAWVSPFGWTWCADEPWGWAPYHYGTWFVSSGVWLWRPGPAQQCWSPAVVHFSTNNGQIAWCPLAPSEVRYPPAVTVAFRSGDWSLRFSIGGAASYYPEQSGYCTPRPFNNATVNRTTNVYNITKITNITNVTNNYVTTNTFIPHNLRVPGAATVSNNKEFAAGGQFARSTAATTQIFTRGQSFAPPIGSEPRFAGPASVRITAQSFSPSHVSAASQPPASIVNRVVVQTPIRGKVGGWSQPMQGVHVLPVAPRTPPVRVTPPARVVPPTRFVPPARVIPPVNVVPTRPNNNRNQGTPNRAPIRTFPVAPIKPTTSNPVLLQNQISNNRKGRRVNQGTTITPAAPALIRPATPMAPRQAAPIRTITPVRPANPVPVAPTITKPALLTTKSPAKGPVRGGRQPRKPNGNDKKAGDSKTGG